MGRSVGSSQCTLYAPEANRISIFIDLFRHFAAKVVSGQFVILSELAAELFHALADGGHGFGCAVIVQAFAASRRSDTHGFAQAVEDQASPAQLFYRLAKRRIFGGFRDYSCKL